MRELIETADSAIQFGDRCVLCTVVRLQGSGYGQPGARLLLTEAGERVGYISGGCLEKDLCRRVWDATEVGPRLIAFDTRGNSVDTSPAYNTGCEGIVYVLAQRLENLINVELSTLRDVWQTTDILPTNNCERPAVLATIYRSDNPQWKVGDCIALKIDGSFTGSFIDSCPSLIIDRMRKAREEVNGCTIEFTTYHGVVEASIEVLQQPRQLIIFGAGDDAQPLAQMADMLGWRVIVVGRSAELACRARFPKAKVLCGPMDQIAKELILESKTEVVIMSHDFSADKKLVPILLQGNCRSVGMLGPKRRLARLIEKINRELPCLDYKLFERLRAPIGLNIGANTPVEIAVSIVGELLARQQDRDARPLHQSGQAIHQVQAHEILQIAEYCDAAMTV